LPINFEMQSTFKLINMKNNTSTQLNRKIKRLIILFIAGLCLSGITAFPLLQEISFLNKYLSPVAPECARQWIRKVYEGITAIDSSYPFMAYGTDWLAFAHLVIAVVFIGPFRDPVRNIWVIQFGRIACCMIFPLAFICGTIRGIPFWWELIDCSFGVFGLILLTCIYRNIQKLESITQHNNL
jgi:hypothetical protein